MERFEQEWVIHKVKGSRGHGPSGGPWIWLRVWWGQFQWNASAVSQIVVGPRKEFEEKKSAEAVVSNACSRSVKVNGGNHAVARGEGWVKRGFFKNGTAVACLKKKVKVPARGGGGGWGEVKPGRWHLGVGRGWYHWGRWRDYRKTTAWSTQ